MKAKIERAVERMHLFLGAVEELYDYDLMVIAANALLPIYLVLQSKLGIEPESKKTNCHLRLI